MSERVGTRGVYLATKPLNVTDGFGGDMVLCIDVPEDLFGEFDVTDESQVKFGCRIALVPAARLNGFGKP